MKNILNLIHKYNEEYNVYTTIEFSSNSVILIIDVYAGGTSSNGTYLQNKRILLRPDIDSMELALKDMCEQVQSGVKAKWVL